MQQAIDELLRDSVERQDLCGVSMVVVDAAGTLYEGAFGRAFEGGGEMAVDTVATIASMTKAVTGAAAMQLVEQGRLKLDAAAAEVVPYLGEVQVFDGFDSAGEPMLRPPHTPVTLRNLLTHTSGFVYEIWNADFAELIGRLGIPSFSSLQKASLRVPLMFDPGTRWEYGIGIDWVGQMIEAVTGQTLGEYFAEHLTGPLGMADTGFQPMPGMAERLARMSLRQADGTLVTSPVEPRALADEQPEFEMGGGGLLSTARGLRQVSAHGLGRWSAR